MMLSWTSGLGKIPPHYLVVPEKSVVHTRTPYVHSFIDECRHDNGAVNRCCQRVKQ